MSVDRLGDSAALTWTHMARSAVGCDNCFLLSCCFAWLFKGLRKQASIHELIKHTRVMFADTHPNKGKSRVKPRVHMGATTQGTDAGRCESRRHYPDSLQTESEMA